MSVQRVPIVSSDYGWVAYVNAHERNGGGACPFSEQPLASLPGWAPGQTTCVNQCDGYRLVYVERGQLYAPDLTRQVFEELLMARVGDEHLPATLLPPFSATEISLSMDRQGHTYIEIISKDTHQTFRLTITEE